jgi:hypothetical protein
MKYGVVKPPILCNVFQHPIERIAACQTTGSNGGVPKTTATLARALNLNRIFRTAHLDDPTLVESVGYPVSGKGRFFDSTGK